MKKRIHLCFLVLTMSVFYLFISNVVFGESPTEQVTRNYKSTLLNDEVRPLLPNFLNVFKGSKFQKAMLPYQVGVLLSNPIFLRTLAPGTDTQFIGLLYANEDFRTLFGDEQFYKVLKNSEEIDALLKWFGLPAQQVLKPVTSPLLEPEPTTLRIVSGNNQSGEVSEPLAQPFVVGVLDQYKKPLQGTTVTFRITADNGRLSETIDATDVYGQARTTLTLGAGAVPHSVTARAAGITQTQTFTATAVAPPQEKSEPVVMPPPTEEPALPPMYWIAGNTIYYQLPGGEKEIFLEPRDRTLTGGLAVDMEGKKVYWTERTINNMGRIQSADLDRSNVDKVKGTIAVPYDIAFDTEKKNLYWTNSNGKIQRINVEGSNFRGDFIKDLNEPKHIAFDVEVGRLYWTDAEGIWSIYADNKTGIPRQLDKKDLGKVGGIAVSNDVVYWTEQASSDGSSDGKVRSINRNGSGDKLLASLKELAWLEEIIPGGIAVDAGGGKVYWTTSHGIQSARLTGEPVVIRKEEPAGIALGGTAGVRNPPVPSAPSLSRVVSVENTLLANYPNPFNPETWIPYQLSVSADVSVSIYAVDGRLVRRLDLGHQSAGVYRSRSRAAYWDGRNAFGERVASGLYFYTLTAGDFTATRKMLIRK